MMMTYLLLLNIYLDELDTRELVLHLGEMGRDHLAWSAPSCPKVNNDGLIAVDLHVSGILTQGLIDDDLRESGIPRKIR